MGVKVFFCLALYNSIVIDNNVMELWCHFGKLVSYFSFVAIIITNESTILYTNLVYINPLISSR